MTQLEVLLTITDIFAKLRIEYMLTGAYAVSFHGKPRSTLDIDFVVEVDPKDIPRIIQGFKDDFYISEEAVRESLQYGSMFNIIHNETSIKADFWIKGDSAFEESRFERKVKGIIDGRETFFSSAEDTILKKLLWFKESEVGKHLDDVVGILEVQQGRLDMEYLQTLSSNLEVEIMLREAMKRAYGDS